MIVTAGSVIVQRNVFMAATAGTVAAATGRRARCLPAAAEVDTRQVIRDVAVIPAA